MQIAGTSSSSVEVSSVVQLSSWDSGVINDDMDLDVNNDSGKSSVPNSHSSKEKVGSGPCWLARPAARVVASSSSSSSSQGPRTTARSTPTVANTGICHNRD